MIVWPILYIVYSSMPQLFSSQLPLPLFILSPFSASSPTDVSLSVDRVVHSTDTTVTFTAAALPKRTYLVSYYTWDFGEVGKVAYDSFNDVETHVYRRHGKWVLTGGSCDSRRDKSNNNSNKLPWRPAQKRNKTESWTMIRKWNWRWKRKNICLEILWNKCRLRLF